MSEIKILIKGSIGNSNLGDDLLVYSIDRLLKNSGIPCKLYYRTKHNYYSYIPDSHIYQPFRFQRFDVVLFAGGTQFASFGKKALSFNDFIKLLFKNPTALLKHFSGKLKRNIESFNVRYKSLVLAGIGIGPFYEDDQYYRDTIALLKSADLVIVRDELSVSICNEHGIPHIHGCDLAYTLPLNFKVVKEKKHIQNIAVIVRDWQFSEEKGSYIDTLLDLTTDCKITYFSFCRAKDEIGLNKIRQHDNSALIEIWDPEGDIEAFINKLADYDLVITARYHGAIIASLCRIPFISIGIEPKLEMVAKLFKMPVWELPYMTDALEKCIGQINDNYSDYCQRIEDQVNHETAKAQVMTQTLTMFLKQKHL